MRGGEDSDSKGRESLERYHQIIPNPATDHMTIFKLPGVAVEIEIYTIQSQRMMSEFTDKVNSKIKKGQSLQNQS